MPKSVDPRARREQIARALWRVTATHGLDAVSLRHVAAEAGVSMGMVQHWFRTKDEMLRFALQTVSEQSEARIGRHLDVLEHGPPREAVRTLMVEMLPLDEQRRLEAHVAVAFGARAAVSPPIAASLRDGMDQLRAFIADKIRFANGPHRPNPGHAAAALVAMVDGLAAHTLAEQCTPEAALAALDDQLDMLFGRPGEGSQPAGYRQRAEPDQADQHGGQRAEQ
ncbi:TetR/AcrR family transcriptional regulator [Pseudonocardia acaciae]|uniref:TetR/AcrR family transcriptional regulator n=1 Tax=Pseudonocardia acaciae TaxID=551276 RepID=UPI0007E8E017|nr:TetR/AcrR family transcriptional regulator [Pseudonocardia acaciae]